ncbi:MAG TPA: hypothetical protein VEX65_10875 [Flavisolibacter sp.]|nr:hypothetical protein [Flavisolibacter sp.]
MDVWAVLLELSTGNSPPEKEGFKQQIATHLNDLLLHDFSRLIQLLYRVDVDEKRVKAVLQQHPHEDAGLLLTELLIERQKGKSHKEETFSSSRNESNEERW